MGRPRSVLETLRAAYKYVANRKTWTTRTFARDKSGIGVSPHLKTAVKFCSLGALQKVDGPYQNAAEGRLYDAAQELFCSTVVYVNDRKGRKATLAMWKRALGE